MSADAEAALRHLEALWERERHEARRRHAETRERLPLKERVERGLALPRLDIDEAAPAAGGRTTLVLSRRDGVAIDGHARVVRPGDPVLLIPRDGAVDDGVRAVVSRIRRGRCEVVVDGDYPVALEAGGFHLERAAPESTFDRGRSALRRWRSAKPASDVGILRETLFGERALEPRAEVLTPFDTALDPSQREAVAWAVGSWPVALIHGPPGTGKTRTLVEVIRQLVARGQRVLATAASNTAVDNLAERLIAQGVAAVRVGHPARVMPSVEDHTVDAMIEASEASKLARRWVREAEKIRRKTLGRADRGGRDHAQRRDAFREMRRLYRDAREHLNGARAAVLARHAVVCATASGVDDWLLRDETFDVVVLDEATQAPDPMALIALGAAPRAILAGDPCQLPPTVLDRTAASEGLGTTLFERCQARHGEACVRMLTTQYRMHRAIMRFPSEQLYQGRLEAADDVADHVLQDLPGVAEDPLRVSVVTFVDAAGKGWAEVRSPDDPSTSNPEQAVRVAAEARRLIGRGVAPGEIAVIAPYDRQVRILRELLADAVADGLEIGSVDGFQGREKEAVIVDLVRSNESGSLGFLTEVRRMNVALTRARRWLLVVGDSGTFGHHPFYSAFFDAVDRDGLWLSAWADDAPPF